MILGISLEGGSMDQKDLDRRLVSVVPHERQIAFQQTEFYAFVHFTVNTFTDREWGDGEESPEIFFPEKLDAKQWVKAIVSAGMKGLILTCKHPISPGKRFLDFPLHRPIPGL